jgi:hypothetical protein
MGAMNPLLETLQEELEREMQILLGRSVRK